MIQLLAGSLVQVRSELGEGRQFTVLSQSGTDTTGQLLDDLGLSGTTHAGYRDTGVDGRTDTRVEHGRFQEDLTVGDRDHVGRNERGNVASLGFDDRQSGQGTGLALHGAIGELLDVLFGNAGSALQQTAVEIEHVARVGFTARRTAQQQGDLAVGNGLLGQVVVHDQSVFTAVAEVFAHGATGVRREELQGSRLGRGRGHDDGVGQSASFFQLAHHVGDGRLLLTDSHVDAADAAVLLVDDGVDGQSGFTDLTVTDDQLALATADRDHGVNRLVTGLYRLVDRLTPDHARCNFLDGVGGLSIDRAFAIDRVTQRVDYAAQQFRTNRDFQDAAGALGAHAFGEAGVSTQHNGTDGVLLQVQRHTVDTTRELDHFAVHNVGQTVDTHDTVGDGYHGTFVAGLGRDVEFLDTPLDDFTNFGRIELLHCSAAPSNSRFQRFGQLRDFAANRAIDNQVACADNHTTDEGGVFRHMQTHFSAEPCVENLGEFVLLFCAQCEGTGHFHVHRFFLLGLVQLELGGDFRQQVETTVFGDDGNEVACLGVELVTTHFVESGGLLCARQTRGLEHALHGVVLRHRRSQAEHG